MAARASLVESGIVTSEQLLPIKGLRPRLSGGQGHCSRAIPELPASGGFTAEKAMKISRKFDTNFPVAC